MPVWGIAGAPLVERDAVIVQIGGEGNACVVAFDARTGRERWRALGDNPSYSAPIVIRQAGRRVLVCWTGDRVVGLDPASGRLHWEYPFPSRQVVIAIATPVIDGDRLFLTSFYQGSLMLRLLQDRLGVEKLWQRRGASERDTDALHSIISTPIIQGDFVYGVDSYGELRCLDARSGDRVWEDRTAVPRERWATIHFVKNGERVWMFNDRGELIIARLTPQRFEEISRAFLIRPTLGQLPEQRRGGVAWSHPAFAGRRIYLRNDDELICVDLSAPRPARAGG
jgi:outer membrane protein assembly factor BamB